MPSALAIGQRQEIVRQRESGESYANISVNLQIPYETVRGIYRHHVETGDFASAYDRCRHTKIRKDQTIYDRAVELKRAHPSWGAGLIWVELAEEFSEDKLPSQRTLQRWFRRAGVQKPPTDRQPTTKVRRGKTVHEVWAIDAKEQIKLNDGSYVSWIAVTDEASGAMLDSIVFPPQELVIHRSPSGQTGDSSLAGEVGMSSADAV